MSDDEAPAPTAAWVLTQKKTFSRWANTHLRKKGFDLLEDVDNDFDTGIKLVELISALFPETPVPKLNKNPKMRPFKLDNVEQALAMVSASGVKTNFLGPTHLVDHDQKMILGMLWSIILHYQIAGISVDELTAKEGLLLWVQKKTAGYRDVDPPTVKNFSTDWKSGLAFCALIHRHRPDLIDYDSLDKANAEENIELAFSIAESELGIPRLLDVEDLTVVKPDERAVMTQVSEYFHVFASYDIKEKSARRIKKFANFNEEMEQEQEKYGASAHELLAWIEDAIARLSSPQFGDTYEQARSAFDAHKAFIVQEKPQKASNKLDLESKVVNIQTRLRVNGRRGWTVPDDVSSEAIDDAWNRLAEAEKSYGRAVRDNMFRFITKSEATVPQAKLDEFEAAFDHFDKDGDNALDPVEFKAALAAIGIPFADDAEFDACYGRVSEGTGSISKPQFVAYMCDLEADTDSPQQIKDSFAKLADGDSVITMPQLSVQPLDQHDLGYLGAKMDGPDGRYDYGTYVDSSFDQ